MQSHNLKISQITKKHDLHSCAVFHFMLLNWLKLFVDTKPISDQQAVVQNQLCFWAEKKLWKSQKNSKHKTTN